MRTIIDESNLNLNPDEIAALLVSGSGEVEQGTDEWFEARLGKVTASRVADVLGTAYKREQYMYELVVERLTSNRKRFSSKYTDWGIKTEEEAAGVYAELTGSDVRETGFHEHDTLAAGASPDRLVDDDGLVQIKCPNTDTHIKYMLSGQVPKIYYWQMLFELWITGRQWNDFMSYDPVLDEVGAASFIVRLERDEEKVQYMADKVTSFLEDVTATENKIREMGGTL